MNIKKDQNNNNHNNKRLKLKREEDKYINELFR